MICKRKGVRIQAKTGYYAWAEPPGTRTQQAFNSAASNPFDAAEIGLRANVSFDPQGGRLAHFDLRIDAHDVALVQEGNDDRGQLRLLVVHYLTDGGVETEPMIPVDLHFDPQQYTAALKEGTDFAQNVPIGKSGNQFRVIVFDRGSNALGSLTLPDHDNSRLSLPQLNGQ